MPVAQIILRTQTVSSPFNHSIYQAHSRPGTDAQALVGAHRVTYQVYFFNERLGFFQRQLQQFLRSHGVRVCSAREQRQRVSQPHDIGVRPEHGEPLVHDVSEDARTDEDLRSEGWVSELPRYSGVLPLLPRDWEPRGGHQRATSGARVVA